MREFTTAILGAGPAGTGLLVAAAQRGTLERRLDGGVALVDKSARVGSGSLSGYALNSDSLATSFVECLEAEPARELLARAAASPVARDLIDRRYQSVPLDDVARYLAVVGESVTDRLARHPNCAWLRGTAVRSLRLEPSGTILLDLGETTVRARSVVLALGASQRIDDVLAEHVAGVPLERFADRIMLSDPIVRLGGAEPVRRRLERGANRVVIIGGSHSAFSVAWVLTEALPRDFPTEGITILHRERIRIFYPTPAEAREDGYDDVTAADICPRTGRVHRLGGLRADGRELWRRVSGRASPVEQRVRIEPITDRTRVTQLLERADVVIPAFGYRPHTVPVHDASGRRLELAADRGGLLVDASGRVRLAEDGFVPGLFAIGLAAGFLPPGEPSFHGEANGVWLYHNVAGEIVLDGIDAYV